MILSSFLLSQSLLERLQLNFAGPDESTLDLKKTLSSTLSAWRQGGHKALKSISWGIVYHDQLMSVKLKIHL